MIEVIILILYGQNKASIKYETNYYFEHGSQSKVKFWLNFDFIPKEYRYRIYSDEAKKNILGLNKGGVIN